MKLKQYYLTENNCYKAGKKHTVKGIMVHSTGANNPTLKRYVGPDDGILGTNTYGNHWNTATPGGRQVCVHAFIGKDKNGDIRTYQTLPWDIVGWHSGSGRLGSSKNANNNGYIGFEICEDGLTDRAYFNKVYTEAVELCAYLCKLYSLDPTTNIICHSEGHKKGIATNHGDVMHWFPKHGKDMDIFRADVKKLLNNGAATAPSAPTPAPKPDGSAEQRIWDFLKGKGLNDYAVAGIMGNLYAESGLNPCNLQNTYNTKLGMSDAEYTAAVDNGSYTNFVRDSAGYGLVQWTYWSRKEALLNFAKAQKASIGSLEMQLAFLWDELSKGYASVIATLKSATSIQAASTAILTQYERPADQSTAAQNKRAGFGKTYYDKYAKASTPTPTPAPTNPTTGCKVGDIVNFSGGPVYSSANAATAAHTRNASRCKVTQVYNGKHPYHCISEDGKGVYGWVDAANVGAASASSPKIAVGSTVRITGDKYATGQGIPGWVKKSTHTVSQINGSKALLGANGGICSWVNLADLTLA